MLRGRESMNFRRFPLSSAKPRFEVENARWNSSYIRLKTKGLITSGKALNFFFFLLLFHRNCVPGWFISISFREKNCCTFIHGKEISIESRKYEYEYRQYKKLFLCHENVYLIGENQVSSFNYIFLRQEKFS